MDQLALTACVVLGIVFGVAVARFLGKGAMTALEARVKAEAQREAVALSERVAAKETRLVELTRDNLDAKRRLEEALDHAARLNGAQQQFDTQLAELKRQGEEKLALVTRSHERALEALRAAHEEKADQAEKYAIELAARAETAKEEAEALRDEVAALRAEQVDAQARVAASGEAQAKLEQALRVLTVESSAQNSQAAKQQSIDEAIRPLRDVLARIAGAIAGMERDRSAALAGLSDQVASLLATQQQIQSETQGLAAALSAPASRGCWGELQLRRVVELAGMLEHCDFEPAGSPAALAVHLPSQRLIAVDAGLSLDAFTEAFDAPENLRAAKLREHASAVREYVSNLASPEYWSLFPQTPELVVGFLPGEAPFSAALEQDAALLEFGASQNVLLATPATLIALLRSAAHGWQQYQLTENAREISSLGSSLFESLADYQARMDDFRGNLERTVESYNTAAGTFESRVLGPVRRFQAIAPAAQIELRPRAIPAPVPFTLAAPSATLAVTAPPAPESDLETAGFGLATDIFEPAALEPAPWLEFDGEPELETEPGLDDDFDFGDESAAILLEAEQEPLAELEPVEPEEAATSIPHAEPIAFEAVAHSASPAETIAEPVAALPSPVFPREFAIEPPLEETEIEPDAELEVEPEPELVPIVAESAVPEIEIDDPVFPEFAPNLTAMANGVGAASVPVPPAPAGASGTWVAVPAPQPAAVPAANAAASASGKDEGSGHFLAFVKI